MPASAAIFSRRCKRLLDRDRAPGNCRGHSREQSGQQVGVPPRNVAPSALRPYGATRSRLGHVFLFGPKVPAASSAMNIATAFRELKETGRRSQRIVTKGTELSPMLVGAIAENRARWCC